VDLDLSALYRVGMDAETLDDATLLEAFETATLPLAAWDHRGHVRVIWIYLERHGLAEATDRMRSGLQHFVAAHGVPVGPTMGYHETLTVAWARVTEATRRHYGAEVDSRAFCDAHPQLMVKTLLRVFYSRPHILSDEARGRFVEPDLAPLPA